jgi:hypothetical protein
LVAASAAKPDRLMATAKPVARTADRAVDRNAAARVDRVTGFPGGESFNR